MIKSFSVIFSCCVVLTAAYNTECGPNQEIRCVRSCPPEKTCQNRQIGYSCLQVVDPCQTKCVCKEGFVRNAGGDCILETHCEPKCTGEHEKYDYKCSNSCPPDPDTCLSFGTLGAIKPKCDTDVVCDLACVCESGYLREEPGSPCIPLCECPQLKNSLKCD